MSAGYGPPIVNTFGMMASLGDTFDKSFAGARKQAAEDRRRDTLKQVADEAGNGPVDLKTLGTKLLTIGDLTGAMTAAQLAQTREDRMFNQGIQSGTLDIARSRLKMDQDGSNSPTGKLLDDAGITEPSERKRLIIGSIEAQQAKAGRLPQTAGEKYRDEVNARAEEIRKQGLNTQEPANRDYILGRKPQKAITPVENPFSQGGTFNNDQGKAAGFTDRMMGSEEVIRQNEDINTGLSGGVGGTIAPYLPNAAKSDARQKFEQARRDFGNAQLRRESGAAIGAKEFENADKQYFPQPGDGPEVIAQKRANRQAAVEAMGREGGPAYRPKKVFGADGAIVPYQPPAPAEGAPAAQPQTGAQYTEGARFRSKSTGKVFVVRNGQPVPE